MKKATFAVWLRRIARDRAASCGCPTDHWRNVSRFGYQDAVAMTIVASMASVGMARARVMIHGSREPEHPLR